MMEVGASWENERPGGLQDSGFAGSEVKRNPKTTGSAAKRIRVREELKTGGIGR